MTRPAPTTPESAPPVRRIIENAIADPGTLAERHCLEDESSWQAGAVVLALAAHGYKIAPAAEPGDSGVRVPGKPGAPGGPPSAARNGRTSVS